MTNRRKFHENWQKSTKHRRTFNGNHGNSTKIDEKLTKIRRKFDEKRRKSANNSTEIKENRRNFDENSKQIDENSIKKSSSENLKNMFFSKPTFEHFLIDFGSIWEGNLGPCCQHLPPKWCEEFLVHRLFG